MNASTLIFVAMFIAAPLTLSPAEACGDYGEFIRLHHLSKNALSEDPEVAAKAIAELRAEGPAGLHTLMDAYWKDIAAGTAVSQLSDQTRRVRAAIDKVAGQKDAHASRLFWYTDLDKALVDAKETNRPILSLRLLGRLDEDLSCANSRFFRTALYANKELASDLRDQFVLHWKSERPVPVITIDFGDGRRICRTITGNSIHYILDAEGKPIDALPGLYGPSAFMRHLGDARDLFVKLSATKSAKERKHMLDAWHTAKGKASDAAWASDLARIGRGLKPLRSEPTASDAGTAALRAVGKRALEMPVLERIGLPAPAALRASTDNDAWAKIAALHAEDARLDDGSKALMRAKTNADVAMMLTVTKGLVEDPMVRAVRTFERSVAEDTVRNEYDFHRTIHEWFVDGTGRDLEELNERVYRALFLTPSSDPWLGLVPFGAYAGLDSAGLAPRAPRTTSALVR